jgi:hypothetical protein
MSKQSSVCIDLPFFSTGARCLIKIGGKPLGVAQSIRWQISYQANEIRTIDTNFPWDIDLGQAKIQASLSMIMDPTKGPEHDGLFHIMSSAIHAPHVELQIIDRQMGTQVLSARGVFTGLTGQVSVGQVGNWGVEFVGIAFQHYVNQNFKPYGSAAGAAGALLDALTGAASDLTGGFL